MCLHCALLTAKLQLKCLYGLQASLNMCSLTMSNLVLASILRVADNCVSAEEESHFILECRNFALRCAQHC